MTDYHDYKLYYSKTCPFCQRVLRFMSENGISMELRDTSLPGVRNELEQVGGKLQVPCLVIGDKAMYESADIIDYLGSTVAA